MANERILIIEDDQQLADELQKYLAELGYQMVAVRRDMETVNLALREASPQLILLASSFDNLRQDPIVQNLWDVVRPRYILMIFLCSSLDCIMSFGDIDIPGIDWVRKPMDIEELSLHIRSEINRIDRWKEQDERWKKKSGASNSQ